MPQFDKFVKGLKDKYDLEYQDVKSNWKYCGGNKTKRHKNYFKLLYPEYDFPTYDSTCVCGHCIIENCYITDGKEFLILGNCCIKAFLEKSGRTCELCGEPHKNRKVNKCNNCKIKYCITCEKEKNPLYIKYKRCYDCYCDNI